MTSLARLACASVFCLALFATGASRAQSADEPGGLQTDAGLSYRIHLPADGHGDAPVIFLLHGYGSNERDLMSLDRTFPQQYAVVSVRAPFAMQEGSYARYAPVESGGRVQGNVQEMEMSAAAIDRLVQRLVRRYHFDGHRVYLVGFSQGATMSYEIGLSHAGKYRGLGIMSGDIYDWFAPLVHPTPRLRDLRIFISHGDVDNRIPVGRAEASYQILRGAGLHPELHIFPGMGHEINSDALAELNKWLQVDVEH